MLVSNDATKFLNNFDAAVKGMNVEDVAAALSKQGINKEYATDLLNMSVKSEVISGNFNDVTKSVKNFENSGSSTLSSLGSIITAHPIATFGAVAAGSLAIAYTAYKNYKQNLISSANQATSTWENQESYFHLCSAGRILPTR